MKDNRDGALESVRTVSGSALLLVALGALLPVAVALAIVALRLGESATWPLATIGTLTALVCLGAYAWRRDRGQRKAIVACDGVTGLGSRRRLIADLERSAGAGVLLLLDLDGFSRYNGAFGHAAGDALLQRLARRLTAVVPEGGAAYRTGGGEFAVLAPAAGDGTAALTRDSTNALCEWYEGTAIRPICASVRIPEDATTAIDALDTAARRLSSHVRSGAHASARAAAMLAQAIHERDAALGLHLTGVADLAAAVARRLGLSTDEVEEISFAALMLDIGTLAIPDGILKKPGPLDESELAVVRRHTIVGERILAAAPALAHCARLVRSSHERYDGTGYPDGLAGSEIPLGARILAVCDAFAAMVTDRPYRRSLTYRATVAELQSCAGTQFDPEVVVALLAELEHEEQRLAAAV